RRAGELHAAPRVGGLPLRPRDEAPPARPRAGHLRGRLLGPREPDGLERGGRGPGLRGIRPGDGERGHPARLLRRAAEQPLAAAHAVLGHRTAHPPPGLLSSPRDPLDPAGIGAFLYARYMPAFGLSQGGPVIFRGMDNVSPLDVEYHDYRATMPWPAIEGNAIRLDCGYEVDFVKPGELVRLRYESPDRAVRFHLD